MRVYRRLDVIYRKRSGGTRQIGDGHSCYPLFAGSIRVHYFGIIFPSNAMYIESLSAARLSRVTLVRSFPTSIRRSIRMQNAYIGVFFLLLASRMGGELRLFGKRIAAPVLAGGIGRFVKRSNYASNYASSASNCYFHKCLSVNRLKFGIRPII